MQRINFCTCVGVALLGHAILLEARELGPRDRGALEQSAVAHHQGNPLRVLQALSPRFNTWDDDQQKSADELLGAVKSPSSLELLVEARVQLALTGQRAPTAGRREAELVLKQLHKRLGQFTQSQATHPALQSPPVLPADFSVYRQYVDDLHYMSLKAAEASLIVQLSDELAMPLRGKKAFARLDTDAQTLVKTDYSAIADQWLRSVFDLEVASIQLRLHRLADAESVLRLSEDAKERFLAAYAIHVDGPRLREILADKQWRLKAGKVGAAFDSEAAHLQVDRILEAAADLAGNLGRKAQLFEDGVAWWLRGRYGAGFSPDGRMKRPGNHADALFTVMMPLTPAVNAPANASSSGPADAWAPLYPRRHHYMWQQDNRRIQSRELQGQIVEDVVQTHSDKQIQLTRMVPSPCGGVMRVHELHSDYSYQLGQAVAQGGAILPNDPAEIYRQVGYIEYSEALRRFDELLPQLNDSELEAVEEIVSDDPRLKIEVNLSRHVAAQGPLAEKPLVPNDDFRRHGFPWVIALARIEVAGVLAAMTDMPNPFLNIKVTNYERAAYQEMILDGFRSHVYTLRSTNPTAVSKASSRVLLASHRRTMVTLQLAEAARTIKLTPEQHTALASLATNANLLRGVLEKHVNRRLRTVGQMKYDDKVQRKSDDPEIKSFDTKK